MEKKWEYSEQHINYLCSSKEGYGSVMRWLYQNWIWYKWNVNLL